MPIEAVREAERILAVCDRHREAYSLRLIQQLARGGTMNDESQGRQTVRSEA